MMETEACSTIIELSRKHSTRQIAFTRFYGTNIWPSSRVLRFQVQQYERFDLTSIGCNSPDAGIRAELDTRSEKISKKIRDPEISKIPCMIVIGQKEQESGEVSLRRHRIGDEGRFSVSGLIDKLKQEITGRT